MVSDGTADSAGHVPASAGNPSIRAAGRADHGCTTGYHEGIDTGYEMCAHDNYAPCPVFGFLCYPSCSEAAGRCYTTEQRAMTRAWFGEPPARTLTRK